MDHAHLTGKNLHISKTSTGSISPMGIQTPTVIGEMYSDTTAGTFWVATGLTNTSWKQVSGGSGSTYSFNTPLNELNTVVSITKADNSTDGYLSSSDWNRFNSGVSFIPGNLTSSTGLTITNGIGSTVTSTGTKITISNGYHLPTTVEVSTWNNKQNILTIGNLTTSTGLTITNGTGSIIGSGTSIKIANGYHLPTIGEQTNWNTAYSDAHLHSNKTILDNINQNLGTSYSPSFTGLTVGSSTGLMKRNSGVISTAIAGTDYTSNWSEVNILYVGKHGSDSNDGSNIAKAFLTITHAISVAVSKTPSSTNRIEIHVTDAGQYTENITVPSWIGIIAVSANIIGNHIVNDNSLLQSFRITTSSGTAILKSSGSGAASISCQKLILTDDANGVMCNSGSINYVGQSIDVINGIALGNLSTDICNINVIVISITGSGIAAAALSSGRLLLFCGSIYDNGSGYGFYLQNTGEIDATIARVSCDTAYYIYGKFANLRLTCASLSGSTSGKATYISADIGIETNNVAISTNLTLASFTSTGILKNNSSGLVSGGNKIISSDVNSSYYLPTTADESNWNGKDVVIQMVDRVTSIYVNTSGACFPIPARLNGMHLSSCYARVVTAGTGGSANLFNFTKNGSNMLSTSLMINVGDLSSDTALVPYVIDPSHSTVSTKDFIVCQILQCNDTAPLGLSLTLTFSL